MPRGAPKGNSYAQKEPAKRRQGISVSYYVRADPYEFLRDGLEFETGNGSKQAVRTRIEAIFSEAINREIRRLMAVYGIAHEKSSS